MTTQAHCSDPAIADWFTGGSIYSGEVAGLAEAPTTRSHVEAPPPLDQIAEEISSISQTLADALNP
jgi:hypothetical protein